VRRADANEEFGVPADSEVVALADLASRPSGVSERGAEEDAFSLIFALPFDASVVDAYAPASAPPEGRPTAPPPSPPTSWMTPVGIAGVAVGGVTLLAGGTLGVAALLERAGERSEESGLDAQRRNERITTFGTGAVLGLSAGAVLLTGGIALLVLPSKGARASTHTRAPSTRLLASPCASGAGIVVGGSF
jgi:hypothetical protein